MGLPVIAAGARIRVAYMIASAGLFLWLSSRFYLEWAGQQVPVIDGGSLGILRGRFRRWSARSPTTQSCGQGRRKTLKHSAWSVVLMLVGYLLSCGGGRLAHRLRAPPTGRSPSRR